MSTTPRLEDLQVKLFTDGADKAQILDMAQKPWIKGFTTNPSLLRKAGVTDYEAYGRDLVAAVPDRHISFEVFSDDIPEMVAQARLITTWGNNVYVKLPVSTTRGEMLYDAVRDLSRDGVKVNVTAIFTAGAGDCDHRGAGRRRARLRLGVRRTPRRPRHRLSPDHAGGGRARAPDRECRDHLGIDPRSLQRDRGARHAMPHHHGARRRVEEASRARHEDRKRALARCRQGVPRGRARRKAFARSVGIVTRRGVTRNERRIANGE